MNVLFLMMLSRVFEQRNRRVRLLKEAEGGSGAVQTDSVDGQNRSYPGNKNKKLELSIQW